MKGYIKIHKMLETQNVHAFAREKLAAYGMMGEVIGTRIFDIVEKERSGETVVGLNQSLPLEKRVMAAAYGCFIYGRRELDMKRFWKRRRIRWRTGKGERWRLNLLPPF